MKVPPPPTSKKNQTLKQPIKPKVPILKPPVMKF